MTDIHKKAHPSSGLDTHTVWLQPLDTGHQPTDEALSSIDTLVDKESEEVSKQPTEMSGPMYAVTQTWRDSTWSIYIKMPVV